MAKTDLNPEQHEAVEHKDGPILVIAGAGSGKTKVVTQRIVRLIEKGVPPQHILALTFTNKAAQEMQRRIQKVIHCQVLVCTFHSLGARILRESIPALGYGRHFAIYDEDDVEKVLKSCLSEIEHANDKLEPKSFRLMISRSKNAMLKPEDVPVDTRASEVERLFPQVYAAYQKRLQHYNAVDFDDLLYLTVRLFQEHPSILAHYQERWGYLLIDEYQDTNASQYHLVQLLVAKHHNLCVVGDPDQSIYSWRGADLRNILQFEKDYPNAKVVRLEQNYRSRSNILESANAVISHNQNRLEKALWSDLGEGEPIHLHTALSDRDEVHFVLDAIRRHQSKGVLLSEIVIFYRTNFQSRIFEDALLSRHIPYAIVGGISFYQRKEIKDILAYLRMVQSDQDYVSFERTINVPKRGIGITTIEKLRDGAIQAQLPILDFCAKVLSSADATIRLSAKQKAALLQYVNLIQLLRTQKEKMTLKDLMETVVSSTDYRMVLAEDEETFDDRLENLHELVSTAAEWEEAHPEGTLGDFLEELSLKSSLDEVDASTQHVSLMTLHNGKGLEFKVVFIVGLEEDLFPHANARDSESALEEERRLCYVGMTRAKEYLYMSYAKVRLLWGSLRQMRRSRFLREIPARFCKVD